MSQMFSVFSEIVKSEQDFCISITHHGGCSEYAVNMISAVDRLTHGHSQRPAAGVQTKAELAGGTAGIEASYPLLPERDAAAQGCC